MLQRKCIDTEWLEERIAIKLEPIRRPTPKQEHDALNECLREFRDLYGEFEIVRWPDSISRPPYR